MPELPEVETIRRDLEKNILRKPISSLRFFDLKISNSDKVKLKKILVGQSLISIQRRAKILIFTTKLGTFVIHLKMTGQLIYQSNKKITGGGHGQTVPTSLPSKSTRLIINFLDGSKLFFNDQRKFGYVRPASARDLESINAKHGPEPFKTSFKYLDFVSGLKNKRKNIKAIILEQSLVAGLGNIYADEVLFRSGIRPTRLAVSLKSGELKLLYANIIKLINLALKHRGTTFSDYRDASGRAGNFIKYLQVYGRSKERCLVCGGEIKKIKVAGRGTHYCPKCQV